MPWSVTVQPTAKNADAVFELYGDALEYAHQLFSEESLPHVFFIHIERVDC